jgi:hypothetical protein
MTKLKLAAKLIHIKTETKEKMTTEGTPNATENIIAA